MAMRARRAPCPTSQAPGLDGLDPVDRDVRSFDDSTAPQLIAMCNCDIVTCSADQELAL